MLRAAILNPITPGFESRYLSPARFPESWYSVDTDLQPGNIHGGFNFYRANLSLASQPWTPLDRTISDCPVTFIQGMSDPVVPSTWTDLVTPWYSNYTIEYVEGCGHFVMREQPEYVNRRLAEVFSA